MLKKIVAILLMTLLLFNWFGYKLALNFMQKQADLRMETRIDGNEYEESQLVELRVPLQLPYQNTWTEFERCYGEIEIDGQLYTYVKRKVEENFLVLKCLPNHNKQVIKATDNILFQAFNGLDLQNNGKQSSPLAKILKNILVDYDDHNNSWQLKLAGQQDHDWLDNDNQLTSSAYLPVGEQPPETIRPSDIVG
ncbi:MAG: hypothetical protein H7Y42_18810 [Chitinophagaceae bacterium]|nr:hypothetical protein [Chitinophagaceae bacterium]